MPSDGWMESNPRTEESIVPQMEEGKGGGGRK